MASDEETDDEADDEAGSDEDRPSVPQTKKGTLLGTGAVKNPLLAAAEAKYEKKVPLSQPPAPMVKVPAVDPAALGKKKVAPPPPRIGGLASAKPPPPPPPPNVTGGSSLSKPPPAPRPRPKMPPSPIAGVPKKGDTKLGVPAAKPAVDTEEAPVAPYPLAPSALGTDGDPLDLPTASPMGDPRTILIGGAAALVAFIVLVITVTALSGGDDEEEELASVEETAHIDEVQAGEGEATGETEEHAEGALPEEEVEPELLETEIVELTAEQHDEVERLREAAREHWGAGRFLEAAGDYRAASDVDPTNAGLFAGMGAALSNAGELDAAIAAYEQAIVLDPHSSGFQAALGRVLRANGDEDEAAAAYREAIALDPENQAAQRALREMGSD